MNNRKNSSEIVLKYFDSLLEQHKDDKEKWLCVALDLKQTLRNLAYHMNECSIIMDKLEEGQL